MVRDDGVGVPDEISEFRPESIGVGIGGMRQRIKELGGELVLRKAHPGTIVEAVIPTPSRPREVQAGPVTYPSSKPKAMGTSTRIGQNER